MENLLNDHSSLPTAEETDDSGHFNKMFDNVLSEYDIVSTPDPTSSVSVIQDLLQTPEYFPGADTDQ